MKTYDEYFTEAEKVHRVSLWARAKAKKIAFDAFTGGSKTELKRRFQRQGGWKKVIAGALASLLATGELKKYNTKINTQVDTLEHNYIMIQHASGMLLDMLNHGADQDTINEHAGKLRESAMILKHSSKTMIDAIDEYRRINDEDKRAGSFRASSKELNRHDWREIYEMLRTIDDVGDMASKASAAASVGHDSIAKTFLHRITTTEMTRAFIDI